nr:MAG TPA: hypothetical protein [Caudoviricetes sp.]
MKKCKCFHCLHLAKKTKKPLFCGFLSTHFTHAFAHNVQVERTACVFAYFCVFIYNIKNYGGFLNGDYKRTA